MASHNPQLSRVRLLALPESSASVLYGLNDVLSSVGDTWRALTGERHNVKPFDVQIVGSRTRMFRCAGGVPVTPSMLFSEARADIVVVTDLAIAPDFDPRGHWEQAVAWIKSVYEQGAVVCSVCTGSVLLAQTGLLDGKIATTHWSMRDLFRTHFPDIDLAPERILVPAGEDHRLITTGGAGAWEDLALYLVARFRGESEAIRTSKIWVIGDRSEGQLPFAAMSKQRRHDDRVIGACQEWIATNYDISNPVAAMIAHSGLADRTFKRRFRSATGYTPVEYVQTIRIEEAKHMLETQTVAVDAVGHAVGYEDVAFFRNLFKRHVGCTPAHYRKRFQSLLRKY